MADHITKQAIDALAAALVAGATAAGSRVFVGRVTPPLAGELPAIMVEGGAEVIEAQTVGPSHLQQRTMTIDVAVLVEELDDYDDEAYALLLQVEHVLAASPTLGGTVRSVRPVSVQWERDSAAERPVVRATLSCECLGFVLNNAVDVPR